MSSSPAGLLYLLPNVLGDTAPDAVIPAAVLNRARAGRARGPSERPLLNRACALGLRPGGSTLRVSRLPSGRPGGTRFRAEGPRTPIAAAEAEADLHRESLRQRSHSGDDAARSRPGYARVRRRGSDAGIGSGENATRCGMAQGNAAAQGTT